MRNAAIAGHFPSYASGQPRRRHGAGFLFRGDGMNRSSTLNSAMQAVTVDRAATHGDVENNFQSIASVWTARIGQRITPAQVAIMLIDLKAVRAWGNPAHEDNWIDIAGYAACGAEVSDGE